MNATDLLEAYDSQLREEGELGLTMTRHRHGPVWWATFDGDRGFVTYRTLGGLEGEALDALIAETVAHFRDRTDVPSFEWKTRGHDAPADLGPRLVAHGLAAEDVETVMIGEASALAVDVALPPEVGVRKAGVGHDLYDDVSRAVSMQDSVFGEGGGPTPESLTSQLLEDPDGMELWLAEVDGEVVCAGRLDVVRGTEFAGIWGGATLARVAGPRHLPGAHRRPGPLRTGSRDPLHPQRLHRHVAPDPRAQRAARRDHHHAVRLDPTASLTAGVVTRLAPVHLDRLGRVQPHHERRHVRRPPIRGEAATPPPSRGTRLAPTTRPAGRAARTPRSRRRR